MAMSMGSGLRQAFQQSVQQAGGAVGPRGMTLSPATVGVQAQQGSPAFQKMGGFMQKLGNMGRPGPAMQQMGGYMGAPQQQTPGQNPGTTNPEQDIQIGYHQDGSPYYAPPGMTPEQAQALAAELWNSGQLYQRPQGY